MVAAVRARASQSRAAYRELLSRALLASPDDAGLARRYADLCPIVEAPIEAAEAWRRVVAIDPGDAEGWSALTKSLLCANNVAEAITVTAEAVSNEPGLGRFHSLHGTALYAAGRVEAAEIAFFRALQMDPVDPAAARGVGRALIRQGAGEALAAHCEACLEALGPRSWVISQYMIAMALLGCRSEVHRLADYDRLLRQRAIETPPGFSSLAAFNTALRHEFNAMSPFEAGGQALDVHHNGLRVFNCPIAAVAEFGPAGAPASAALLAVFEAERQDYEHWLAQFPASIHSRSRPSRSTLLTDGKVSRAGAYVEPHMHPRSWLVAVYYAAVPEGLAGFEPEGCIEFCGPSHRMALEEGLWPSRVLTANPGEIVFFPGYLNHHVHKSRAKGEGMIFTFDIVPTSATGIADVSARQWLRPSDQE